ncbi:hypothetical protein NADE_009284 [Nannochloris sp. 'desiccata']|nr:hypothetical protein KSW81_005970 [Chlorella desiccata (nom. nud.)]KAH7621239.1 hypothetical protein NADE_009284 [Chlorella desiccata (nom. nud.)]
MSVSTNSVRRLGQRLGRRWTTAAVETPTQAPAQTATGVGKAAGADARIRPDHLGGLDKVLKDSPAFRLIFTAGGLVIGGGFTLYHQIYKVKDDLGGQLNNVRVELSGNIEKVSDTVEKVRVELSGNIEKVSDTVEKVRVELSGNIENARVELRDGLRQMREEATADRQVFSNQMIAVQGSIQAIQKSQSEINEKLAKLLDKNG